MSLNIDRNRQRITKEHASYACNPHRVFKIGAPVILTTNICKKTGIVNNAKGQLFDAYYDNINDLNPKILFIKLDDFRGVSVHKTEDNVIPLFFPTADKDRSGS